MTKIPIEDRVRCSCGNFVRFRLAWSPSEGKTIVGIAIQDQGLFYLIKGSIEVNEILISIQEEKVAVVCAECGYDNWIQKLNREVIPLDRLVGYATAEQIGKAAAEGR